MNSPVCWIALLIVWCCLISSSPAASIPSAMPLDEAISRAPTICVCAVDSFQVDPVADLPKPINLEGAQIYDGADAVIMANLVKLEGTYHLHSVTTLKGSLVSPSISVHCGKVLSNYYGGSIKLNSGTTIILFLTKTEDEYRPIDPARPFVPCVPMSPEIVSAIQGKDPLYAVRKILSTSLGEQSLRRTAAYLLRYEKADDVLKAMLVYANDDESSVAESVLFSMAKNERLDAIWKIASFEAKMRALKRGSEAVNAIREFQTSDAVPYLNTLLLDDRSEYTRINAVLALETIADMSSVPYLVIGIRDPEPQGEVSYISYQCLRKLVKMPFPKLSKDEFLKQRKLIADEAMNWWVHELEQTVR